MSPQAPYVPMHAPQKHVSQEEMWEKLAKHAKPQVSVKPLPAGQSPKEKSALEWEKPVRTGERSGYVRTVCGRYSITKDVSGDSVTYSAWRRASDKRSVPVNLGCRSDRESATALCEADVT